MRSKNLNNLHLFKWNFAYFRRLYPKSKKNKINSLENITNLNEYFRVIF